MKLTTRNINGIRKIEEVMAWLDKQGVSIPHKEDYEAQAAILRQGVVDIVATSARSRGYTWDCVFCGAENLEEHMTEGLTIICKQCNHPNYIIEIV